MQRYLLVLALAGVLASALAGALPTPFATSAAPPAAGGAGSSDLPPQPPPRCRAAAERASFTSVKRLRAWNRRMYDLGERLTGSPAHKRYLRWMTAELQATPGLSVRNVSYPIDRWSERESELGVRDAGGELRRLPDADAVPYSRPTGRRGARGPLVYLPPEESIAEHDVAGRIVVRRLVPGSVPNAVFGAIAWTAYDPDGSLAADVDGTYERDYLSYDERIADLEQAAAGGAAGLVFVLGFPTEQVRGHYEPYEGRRWGVPAILVGADAGQALERAAAGGASARLDVSARVERVNTRTLIARLHGASAQRVIVESHSDGINALQENGGLGMLAIARHFAALPRACRSRTLDFVLTTGHLYQELVPGVRNGGAEQHAQLLDRQYDRGGVAAVVAIEHLGAREYTAAPRGDGPGRVLERTGRSEPYAVFVSDSPTLVDQVVEGLRARGLDRTLILRGADAPGQTIPPHQSFGGEGTPYNRHILPTVGAIAGPWSLYNPAFGMQSVDKRRMHEQARFFADLVAAMLPTARSELAGAIPAMRAARDAICATDPTGGGLTLCK